ncbi:MAG: ABC transporter permease [Haloarculaceae archaeon]
MAIDDARDAIAEQTTGEDDDGSASTLVAVAATAVALLVVSPLTWLFLRGGSIPPERALSLLTSDTTIRVTINTFGLVGVVTVASVLLGVPLAYLTVQTDLPFPRFFTITSALPLVVPSYLGAFAFVSAFGPRGVLAGLLAPVGIEQIPSLYGFPGAVLVMTLYTYPYIFLTTRATLLSMDGTVVEAARSLNHTRWEAFKRVTLPRLLPGIAAGALLVALYTLSDFGTPTIMRLDVYTRMIYNEFGRRSLDAASLLSLLLLVMAFAILALESRIGADREGAYVSRGRRRPGTVRLGRWKWPAVAFASLVAVLALVVPVGILLLWLVREGPGYAAGGMPFHLATAWHSVSLSAAAAIICVLAGLPIAYLASRSSGLAGSLPERFSYVGYATPGVVIGLALVYLGLLYVPFLYKSVVLLVFAYVVRFLPQAIGTTKSSLLQVDPRYIEAARSLGYAPLTAFRKVVLPLVVPALAAGGALVFLTAMKELPATLMLRPFGFETFVTYIWEVREQGYYGQAAIPALVLLAVSGLSMLVILGRERFDGT